MAVSTAAAGAAGSAAGDATQTALLAEMQANTIKNEIFTTRSGEQTADATAGITAIGEFSKVGDSAGQISAK